jgi:DNA-binding NarL/FixJ family response regulator
MPIFVLIIGGCEVDYLGFRRSAIESDLDVYRAADESIALQLLSRRSYQVVVFAVHASCDPSLKPIETIRATYRDQAILLMAPSEYVVLLARAAKLGVLGQILTSDPLSKITATIRHAAEGRSRWTYEENKRFAHYENLAASDNIEAMSLSKREKEILSHVIQGETNKRIAQLIGISYETVKEYMQQILLKVGVNDRTQVAVWAVQRQIF